MNKPGRNDPCPCGSGRKYKRCCLGHEAEHDAFGSALAAGPLPLLSRLARFAEQSTRTSLDAVAHAEFPFRSPPLDEAMAARVVDYLIFDLRHPHFGRTAIQQFALEQANVLADEERRTLAAWEQTQRRLYRTAGWSAGLLTCVDVLAETAEPISVWPLGRGAGLIADGAPVALRALPAAGRFVCIGKPTTFEGRSTPDVEAAIRGRHIDYVRSQRIIGIDEFLRLQPKALDEEAATLGRTSAIIMPGTR